MTITQLDSLEFIKLECRKQNIKCLNSLWLKRYNLAHEIMFVLNFDDPYAHETGMPVKQEPCHISLHVLCTSERSKPNI